MDFVFHEGVNGSSPWVDFYPHYNPSFTAGYAFTAIFGLATLVHIVLTIPYKAAYFIPFILGGICSTFGYQGRARSHDATTSIGPWAQQQILLLVAPPLLSASIYMSLSRIMTALDAEHLSPIRPKRLTALFVTNDILCFLTQLVGAGVQVTGDQKLMDIGLKIVLAGLVVMMVVFSGFVAAAGGFHVRLRREMRGVVSGDGVEVGGGIGVGRAGVEIRGWERYMWVLYGVCGCVMVRSLVRTVEFGSGKGAEVKTNEAYIYVFDAALMGIVMVVWCFWHPGRLVMRARRFREGRTGRAGSGVELLESK
ncbi:RTA1 like protein-domain-containing protein [Aspergillus egyptiacus]|nr:RTA1 like protein-domain-containing protein [Aspergillus egyptiacus]